ncbi:hypothetical protein [Amycolatopsis echigonensis]|uniref:Uncharacterized protein n=1 Tax=Amycolatopsis echigonensis TaxID=2576905 RepID=A0A8E2B7A1_9PSEU|nr:MULTISPECIES: hypothetical protein [Amycolatopsis]MBB2503205.1 hypothetical protein [Amycolatopsis echigonensis]
MPGAPTPGLAARTPGLARTATPPRVASACRAEGILAGQIRAEAASGVGPAAKLHHLAGTGRRCRVSGGFGVSALRNTILSGGFAALRAPPRPTCRTAGPGFPPGRDRSVRRGAALGGADGGDGPKRADEPAICQDRHAGTSS